MTKGAEMKNKEYPDMFYRYAFSGKASCKACKNKITQGQYVFVFKGNLYHDVCSQDLKEREKLTHGDFKRVHMRLVQRGIEAVPSGEFRASLRKMLENRRE